jgi:hypothetical protein
MDITHIPEFGWLQFVHVILDNFSHFLVATAWTREAIKDVVAHCLHTFSILEIPKYIKTSNATAYTSTSFFSFCLCFGINLKTGIPYNPHGQGIIEHAHQTLKTQLLKQRGGREYATPANRLNHSFCFKFLNVDKQGWSAAERFWGPSKQTHPVVMWKNPLTNQWMGPDPVLMWGRGFLCIFPRDADFFYWIPKILVRHYEFSGDAQRGGWDQLSSEKDENNSEIAPLSNKEGK